MGLNQIEKEIKDRFWEKVDSNDSDKCWNWTAGTQSKGYGSFGIGNGKTALAHRIAYELESEKIPEGMCIMHLCDNRLCCNPAHLRLGTIAENNRDMVMKGRQVKGEDNGKSKLTRDSVIQMRSDYYDGKLTYENLADNFDVCKSTVRNVVTGKSWKHLPLAK